MQHRNSQSRHKQMQQEEVSEGLRYWLSQRTTRQMHVPNAMRKRVTQVTAPMTCLCRLTFHVYVYMALRAQALVPKFAQSLQSHLAQAGLS
eukprot:6244180-Amphidinium_carterae.2